MKRNRYKPLALLLALWLTLCCTPLTALAEPAGEPEPVSITSTEDFLRLAEQCRLDTWSQNRTVLLEADLDLTGSGFAGIPTFGGILQGQGHTISGLRLEGDGSVQGLFRYLQRSGEVHDLTVTGTVTPGGSRSTVGGIAGVNAGLLQNVCFSGVVSGADVVGGLVGRNEVSGIIEQCSARGIVYGSHFIGGIVGDNHGVVRSSENTAGINTTVQQNEVTLSDITLDTITGTETVTDSTDVGGIAGTSSGVLRDCINRATVGYQHIGYNVGGIAGSQTGYLEGCVNFGDVYARKEGGGIVGQLEPSSTLAYQLSTLQILSNQLSVLQSLTDKTAADAEAAGSELSSQMTVLQSQVSSARSAVSELITQSVNGWGAGGSVLPPNTLPEPSDSVIAARNDLNNSLDGLSQSVSALNGSGSGSAAALGSDLRAITAQIGRISQTLATAGNRSDGDVIQDVSDEDTDSDTEGKLFRCVNEGTVHADLNAGGIVGAIAMENDLDPEDDFTVTGEFSSNVTCRTRAVVRDCENHGTVSAKKQCAGGIAGSMELGCVLNCVNTGLLDSEAAVYVGGIVGSSSNTVRGCAAKCELRGASQVGGIAGCGVILQDNRAMVRLDRDAASESVGAIAGTTQAERSGGLLSGQERQEEGAENEGVSGNYFVANDTAPAAIDGISYDGKAQPLPYDEFVALDGLADMFRTMIIRFSADGVPEQQFQVDYGGALDPASIPEVPARAGYTGHWEGLEDAALDCIRFDETFTAVYTPLSSAQSSVQLREDGRPVALVEGSFASDAVLDLSPGTDQPPLEEGQSWLESWQLQLPTPAEQEEPPYRLHYLPPQSGDPVLLYLHSPDGWRLAEPEEDGSYLVVELGPGDNMVAAVRPAASPLWMVPAAGAGLAVILLAVLLRRRKRRTACKQQP